MITAKLKPADEARFAAALQKMVAISGEPVEEMMRKQGRIAAEKLAWFTQRVGKTAAAGKKQKEDVRKTIDRIYINSNAIAKHIKERHGVDAVKRFRKFIKNGDTAGASQMITSMHAVKRRLNLDIGPFDGGNRHKRHLAGRGKSVLLVTNYPSTVPAYKKRKMANVGALKAGWAKAARDLGGVGKLPAYITKGHKTRGHGSVRGRGGKAVLKISNRADYILVNRKMTDVFRVQAENMEKIITQMIKRRLRTTKRRHRV